VTGQVAEFRSALGLVPLVLLDSDDVRVVTDAITASGVLLALDVAGPVSVVLVGCTGVGKSYLVNYLAGREVVEASVIRPTTTSIVTADLSGWAVTDTPAWGLDTAATEKILADADIGVLVVTPSRYADAATRAAWNSLEECPQKLVALNRQRGTSEEKAVVLASVVERFDVESIVAIDESGGSHRLRDEILALVSGLSAADARRAIALNTARNAAQHIARTVTAGSRDLSRLSDAVASVARPSSIGQRSLSVREGWHETEQEVLEEIDGMLDNLDLEIVKSYGGELSSRILSQMSRSQRADVGAALATWRSNSAERFQAAATIRWRPMATRHVIDDASWKLGVNPSVVVSKRVRRVVGSSFENLVDETHDELLAIADEAAGFRIGDWESSIDEAGSFKPGELLAAADALGRQ
jgi:hypothetical protein